jgi:hypothetical protein
LFVRFDAPLKAKGWLAMGGKSVSLRVIDVPQLLFGNGRRCRRYLCWNFDWAISDRARIFD